MNADIYTPLDGLPGAQLRVDNLAEYIVVCLVCICIMCSEILGSITGIMIVV